MSLNAERFHEVAGVHCPCGRPSRFVRPSNGRVGRRRDHSLCRQCWRSTMDRLCGRRGR